MILFSLKFNGFGDQVLHLFTSWSALIACVLRHQDGQHEEHWKSTKIKARGSHLTFGPHEWSTDVADLLIPQFILSVTVYFDVRCVLHENNSLHLSPAGASFIGFQTRSTAYFDIQAGEAEVGRVGDVEASAVGILSLVLQEHVHHHPPPASLDDPPRSLSPAFTQMAAEHAMSVSRLRTELSGRQNKHCQNKHTRACGCDRSVDLLWSQQVGGALQSQVRHAALVLVAAVPEGQLAK